MKFLFVPLDSVRISPDDVAALRQQVLDEIDDLRAHGHHIIGQHVVTSADHTAVWLLVVLETPYRENGRP